MLLEHASLLIKRSSGCSLLQGPFVVPPSVALSKVLSSRGNKITWSAQRELVAQVIRGSEAHKSFEAFLSSTTVRGQFSLEPEWVGSLLAGTSTGGLPGGRAGGQRGWLPNCRTGWRAFGLACGMAGAGVSQVPTV
jgi:hypothetical protein